MGVSSVKVSGLSGIWQAYESTPLAVIAVNRHQSSISSLESLSTSKYPQLIVSMGNPLTQWHVCDGAAAAATGIHPSCAVTRSVAQPQLPKVGVGGGLGVC